MVVVVLNESNTDRKRRKGFGRNHLGIPNDPVAAAAAATEGVRTPLGRLQLKTLLLQVLLLRVAVVEAVYKKADESTDWVDLSRTNEDDEYEREL
jgi:hypothetical protein